MIGSLVSQDTVRWLRETFAGDAGASADREHEAAGGLGYGWIHYGMVRHMRPARVLAIGSRQGFIPACLALAVRDNGRGCVDFVDANYDARVDDKKLAWDGMGWWTDHTFGPLDPFVDRHLMRTDEYFPRLPLGPRWRYAHIDGAHDYETARFDVGQAALRLEPGGIIALHDALCRQKAFGVWRVCAELQQQGWSLTTFPGQFGLVLAQRPVVS